MSHYDIDIHCRDCGEYLYSVMSRKEIKEVYCGVCKETRRILIESFIHRTETLNKLGGK